MVLLRIVLAIQQCYQACAGMQGKQGTEKDPQRNKEQQTEAAASENLRL